MNKNTLRKWRRPKSQIGARQVGKTGATLLRGGPPEALLLERNLDLELQALKERIEQIEAKQSSYHVPQSVAELKPRRLPPPGRTAMKMTMGQWPGEESTEELLAQLKALG